METTIFCREYVGVILGHIMLLMCHAEQLAQRSVRRIPV